MHKTPIQPHTIWRSAVRRFVEKACACEWGTNMAIERATGGGKPHNIGAKDKALAPQGGLDEAGILSWLPDFQSDLERLLFRRPLGRGAHSTVDFDSITLVGPAGTP